MSHLSHAQARQRVQQLTSEMIVEVIKKAICSGASGFTFTVHPTNFGTLNALEKAALLGPDFGVYPVLPYAAGYVRTVNEKGMSGLLNDFISRLSLQEKARILSKGAVSAFSSDLVGMMKAYIDMEIAGIRRLRGINLRSVLLHEVITDLALSFQSKELLEEYMGHIRDEYGTVPGFVTRNFVRFVRFMEENGISLGNVLIMTPLNKIGFQMIPSRQACEDCLSHLTQSNVFAMSVLAGGYLKLDEAIDYLRGLKNLSGIAVGVSSVQHAEQTFTRLKELTP